ncbi:MAG TPA: ATP-binding protein [Bdellovibrionales bacterium]|nr:ATP-binding protein [Bdellovibrionales bacterium]
MSKTGSRRSLRSILMWWFLPFSIVPLLFLTGYSLARFEGAINDELLKRLDGNAREITLIIQELEVFLTRNGRVHASDPTLVYDLGTGNYSKARSTVESWMKNYAAHHVALFNDEGCMVASVGKTPSGQPKADPTPQAEVCLNEELVKRINEKKQHTLRELRPPNGLEVVVYTRITSNKGRHVGYLEEIININQGYLAELRNRLKTEILVFNSKMELSSASHPDFLLMPKETFTKVSDAGFFDLTFKDEPYGFRVRPLESNSDIHIALGASKKDVKAVLKGINIAMLSVCVITILLLLPILFGVSKVVLKPLDHLVDATQRMESGEAVQNIPVESNTEIGLLTESFNRMSKKVSQARAELEKKVKELEATNKELQTTQAQLIHSAKMVSLGQLVAGVAHELNNPIGFIYSNMSHLKDYSGRLVNLIDVAEKHPEKLRSEKEKQEFDYIVEDLPRLIRSCEDGARRTRDIVLGLRNFSRLDEAKVKEVDLEESVKNTLDLLSGELKTRIQVHTEFANIPPVKCYASQINQVFMNILSNASQAIGEKGEIWVKTWKDESNVYVSIKDSGPGIPSDVVDKIFDPFFTTKPVGQGTGLGLSISYGIIRKHGGDIRVKTKLGEGTEFIINLPLNWIPRPEPRSH